MDYYKLDKNETFLVSLKAFIRKDVKILIIRFPEPENTNWIGEWNGTWGLPGGLLEINEDIEKGLAREVKSTEAIVNALNNRRRFLSS